MKTISTFLLIIFSLVSAAQNSEKIFTYDLKSKSFRIVDNTVDEPAVINNLSIFSGHWTANRNLNIIGSNSTLNPDNTIDASFLLLSSSSARFSAGVDFFGENDEHTFSFPATFTITDSLLSKVLNQKGLFTIRPTDANSLFTFSETFNVLDNSGVIQDKTPISFSSFTDISEAIYRDKKVIESFKFSENVLTDDHGNSLSLRTTNASNTFNSLYSAAFGNGASVIEEGTYLTEWRGSDKVSYATLQAPSPIQAATFILNPSANLSNNNQEGYFVVNTSNNNNFAVGTITSSNGILGFGNPDGTVLTLRAEKIETYGTFSTSGIAVFDGDQDQLKNIQNAIAYFVSNDSKGTNIQIVNGSPNTNAFAGVTIVEVR